MAENCLHPHLHLGIFLLYHEVLPVRHSHLPAVLSLAAATGSTGGLHVYRGGVYTFSTMAADLALVTALLELLNEKPLEEVRIEEICERAGFSRRTFYRHFENRDDAVGRGVHLLLDDLRRRAERGADPTDSEAFLVKLFELMARRRSLIAGVLATSNPPELFTLITERSYSESLARYTPTGSDAAPELIAGFLSGALLGFIRAWIARGCRPEPAAAVKDFLAQLRRVTDAYPTGITSSRPTT
jgi:AcrR family transcriptional regulator